ncbi:hypothetical protein Spock_257 [Bacillus phage Spock]|uniref:Uncharacterized protein n=2 Tax=Bequatrovirus spock TaxID=1918008 RepID=A0A1X9SGA8_9CAUD|nr:hypothetical protein Spock_257 [Bacillus phage Spock]AGY48657.1 hypothetical protein Spock_257 [Bacillus phage Spock]ARQ95172.1 hypothetical protein FLAPJACK_261 [Bacillus phage Flapjack]
MTDVKKIEKINAVILEFAYKIEKAREVGELIALKEQMHVEADKLGVRGEYIEEQACIKYNEI